MKPLETLALKAFLVSLSQLDSLEAGVQAQLKEICNTTPLDIGKLDAIADKDTRWSRLYEDAYQRLGGSTSKNIGKGGKPKVNEAKENRIPEQQNISAEIEDWRQITTQIINDRNPVEAAQKSEQVQALAVMMGIA